MSDPKDRLYDEVAHYTGLTPSEPGGPARAGSTGFPDTVDLWPEHNDIEDEKVFTKYMHDVYCAIIAMQINLRQVAGQRGYWADPVQDVTALAALGTTGTDPMVKDKQIRLAEDTGFVWRYDSSSTAAAGDGVIIPDDVDPADPGRWLQIDAGYVSKAGDTMIGNLIMDNGATVKGLIDPTDPGDAVSYEFLQEYLEGNLSWLEPVIMITNTPPGTPGEGDRYLIGTNPDEGSDWEGHPEELAIWEDTGGGTFAWVFQDNVPSDGQAVVDKSSQSIYVYAGEGGWQGDYVHRSGDTMTGDLNMDGNIVTGLEDPVDVTDAVSLGFLQEYLETKPSWLDPVLDRVSSPPAVILDGDRYLITDTPTGDFAGHANEIAIYADSAWTFQADVPQDGQAVIVINEPDPYIYRMGVWAPMATTGQYVEKVGDSMTGALVTLGDAKDLDTKGKFIGHHWETSDGKKTFGGRHLQDGRFFLQNDYSIASPGGNDAFTTLLFHCDTWNAKNEALGNPDPAPRTGDTAYTSYEWAQYLLMSSRPQPGFGSSFDMQCRPGPTSPTIGLWAGGGHAIPTAFNIAANQEFTYDARLFFYQPSHTVTIYLPWNKNSGMANTWGITFVYNMTPGGGYPYGRIQAHLYQNGNGGIYPAYTSYILWSYSLLAAVNTAPIHVQMERYQDPADSNYKFHLYVDGTLVTSKSYMGGFLPANEGLALVSNYVRFGVGGMVGAGEVDINEIRMRKGTAGALDLTDIHRDESLYPTITVPTVPYAAAGPTVIHAEDFLYSEDAGDETLLTGIGTATGVTKIHGSGQVVDANFDLGYESLSDPGFNVQNMKDPREGYPQDAATKAYVDSKIGGMETSLQLPSVMAVSGIDCPLYGIFNPVDGYTLVAGDRVLCVAQVDPAENLIYEVAETDWIPDTTVYVLDNWTLATEGTLYKDSGWYITSLSPLTWEQFAGPGMQDNFIHKTGEESKRTMGDVLFMGTDPDDPSTLFNIKSLKDPVDEQDAVTKKWVQDNALFKSQTREAVLDIRDTPPGQVTPAVVWTSNRAPLGEAPQWRSIRMIDDTHAWVVVNHYYSSVSSAIRVYRVTLTGMEITDWGTPIFTAAAGAATLACYNVCPWADGKTIFLMLVDSVGWGYKVYKICSDPVSDTLIATLTAYPGDGKPRGPMAMKFITEGPTGKGMAVGYGRYGNNVWTTADGGDTWTARASSGDALMSIGIPPSQAGPTYTIYSGGSDTVSNRPVMYTLTWNTTTDALTGPTLQTGPQQPGGYRPFVVIEFPEDADHGFAVEVEQSAAVIPGQFWWTQFDVLPAHGELFDDAGDNQKVVCQQAQWECTMAYDGAFVDNDTGYIVGLAGMIVGGNYTYTNGWISKCSDMSTFTIPPPPTKNGGTWVDKTPAGGIGPANSVSFSPVDPLIGMMGTGTGYIYITNSGAEDYTGGGGTPPTEGDRYIVGTAPTDAWATHPGEIAEWDTSLDPPDWGYDTPENDDLCNVTPGDEAPEGTYQFNVNHLVLPDPLSKEWTVVTSGSSSWASVAVPAATDTIDSFPIAGIYGAIWHYSLVNLTGHVGSNRTGTIMASWNDLGDVTMTETCTIDTGTYDTTDVAFSVDFDGEGINIILSLGVAGGTTWSCNLKRTTL